MVSESARFDTGAATGPEASPVGASRHRPRAADTGHTTSSARQSRTTRQSSAAPNKTRWTAWRRSSPQSCSPSTPRQANRRPLPPRPQPAGGRRTHPAARAAPPAKARMRTRDPHPPRSARELDHGRADEHRQPAPARPRPSNRRSRSDPDPVGPPQSRCAQPAPNQQDEASARQPPFAVFHEGPDTVLLVNCEPAV
jgi:hypothetical protein